MKLSDPQGVVYVCWRCFTPGRSGYALRLWGYDKSDLSEVLQPRLKGAKRVWASAYLSVIRAILR
ncbi:hypothetical protein CE91St14_20740 [Porphyromonas somerae]|nr:hypothetical protein CE91St14_20740 [Porphyromonas somerae]